MTDWQEHRPRPERPRPIRLVFLGMTTGGYPVQWEGWDHEGYFVYIRYRSHRFSLRIAHDDDDDLWAREPVIDITFGGMGLDPGHMESRAMIDCLPEWVRVEPTAFDHDSTLDDVEKRDVRRRLIARAARIGA